VNIPYGQPAYRIDIKSSSPLRAHSRDSTRLSVREVDHNAATFTYTFEFMVLDPSIPFSSLVVDFNAVNTNQVESVYVTYGRGMRRPGESGWLFPILSIITVGSVAIAAIYFTYSYMMSTQTPTRVGGSGGAAGGAPEDRPQPVSSPLGGATPARLPMPSSAAFTHNQGMFFSCLYLSFWLLLVAFRSFWFLFIASGSFSLLLVPFRCFPFLSFRSLSFSFLSYSDVYLLVFFFFCFCSGLSICTDSSTRRLPCRAIVASQNSLRWRLLKLTAKLIVEFFLFPIHSFCKYNSNDFF
jgi:hypothetical protein